MGHASVTCPHHHVIVQTFVCHLQEAECPLLEGGAAFAGERLAAYVTWLVGRAVSADYEERAKELNDGAAAELRGDPLHIAQPPLSVPPAAEAAVRELAALVDVNVEGRDALQALQAVHRTLRQRVLPAAQLAEAQQRDAAAATAGEAADVAAPAAGTVPVRVRRQGVRRDVGATTLTSAEALDATRFPVGFSTGSAVIDKAATLLRMLYIADLRELQDAVNDILVTVQEFTANPKTDASLGLVGR